MGNSPSLDRGNRPEGQGQEQEQNWGQFQRTFRGRRRNSAPGHQQYVSKSYDAGRFESYSAHPHVSEEAGLNRDSIAARMDQDPEMIAPSSSNINMNSRGTTLQPLLPGSPFSSWAGVHGGGGNNDTKTNNAGGSLVSPASFAAKLSPASSSGNNNISCSSKSSGNHAVMTASALQRGLDHVATYIQTRRPLTAVKFESALANRVSNRVVLAPKLDVRGLPVSGPGDGGKDSIRMATASLAAAAAMDSRLVERAMEDAQLKVAGLGPKWLTGARVEEPVMLQDRWHRNMMAAAAASSSRSRNARETAAMADVLVAEKGLGVVRPPGKTWMYLVGREEDGDEDHAQLSIPIITINAEASPSATGAWANSEEMPPMSSTLLPPLTGSPSAPLSPVVEGRAAARGGGAATPEREGLERRSRQSAASKKSKMAPQAPVDNVLAVVSESRDNEKLFEHIRHCRFCADLPVFQEARVAPKSTAPPLAEV